MKVVPALLAAVSLLLLGVQPVSADVTIRYGVPRTLSPVYIALALGLFAPIEQRHHIRFLFPQYQDGSTANSAMTDSDQDLQLASEDAASCLAGASRLPITLVAFDAASNAECVSNAFLSQHPDVVQDIVDILVRASRFVTKNPDAAAELWSRQLGLPKDVIRASLRKSISAYRRDMTPSKARIDAELARLRRSKVLKATDVPKVDPSFARNALGRR